MPKFPKRIADLRIIRTLDDDGCTQCGGPGLANVDTNPDWEGDHYYVFEGDIYCSISCFEEWHGVELN